MMQTLKILKVLISKKTIKEMLYQLDKFVLNDKTQKIIKEKKLKLETMINNQEL
jgi:hypothetical protein